MKHIEQIQPEYAAVELSRLLVADADATASAALSRLLHDWTGCDIPVTADTPQSDVDELVPLCLSILRRHWQTPLTCLGSQPNGNTGVEPLDLADLFRQLIGDRVQGNEALGIPPVHDNIPAAVSALRQRRIDCGISSDIPDGANLALLLCSNIFVEAYRYIDNALPWVLEREFPISTLGAMRLNCKIANNRIAVDMLNLKELQLPYLESVISPNYFIYNNSIEGDFELPSLVTHRSTTGGSNGFLSRMPNVTKISLPELTTTYGDSQVFMAYNDNLEEIRMPKAELIHLLSYDSLSSNPKLEKVVFGKYPTIKYRYGASGSHDYYPSSRGGIFNNCPNLIHIEIGSDSSEVINLAYWSPTNALAERLDEFLLNFRLYIADRLSGDGSGKTLTLSQEVRDAIHSAGIDTIITNKGWTISPVPTQQ